MSLPEPWVERIFERCTLVYGHQFLSRWDGMALDKVKESWAHELRQFQQNPAAIAYGLENLPVDRPPTAPQFRALCASPHAPRPERTLALPRTVERMDEGSRTVQRIQCVRNAMPHIPEAFVWAFALELKDREEPHKVTPTVRAFYREVIANYQRRTGVQSAVPTEEEAPWQ